MEVSQSSSEADQVSNHVPCDGTSAHGQVRQQPQGTTRAYAGFKHLQNCGENRVSQTSQSEKSSCTLMAKATCFGYQYMIGENIISHTIQTTEVTEKHGFL